MLVESVMSGGQFISTRYVEFSESELLANKDQLLKMKDLHHPNIIRLVDLFHGQNTLLMVQEHCAFKTIAQHI